MYPVSLLNLYRIPHSPLFQQSVHMLNRQNISNTSIRVDQSSEIKMEPYVSSHERYVGTVGTVSTR